MLVTYFLVMKCSSAGVTNVNRPAKPHMKTTMGMPPSFVPCSISIGWTANPTALVVSEKTFTARILGVRVP